MPAERGSAMAATAQFTSESGTRRRRVRWVSAFHWSVTLLAVTFLIQRLLAGAATEAEALDVAAWVAAAVVADLMTVRLGRGVILSMSVPVLLGAAMLHPPAIAALIGFLGCLDLRELRGEIGIERVLFNRAQIALAVATSSLVMAAIGWPIEFPEVLL